MTCGALAADYRLSVDASPDQLAKVKAIRVYGFKFEKGDRIVSVSAAKGTAGSQRISLDVGNGSEAVPGDHQGFGGKVLVGSGSSPAKSFTATLDAVLPPPVPLGDRAKGFVTSPAGLGAIAGLLLLIGAAIFYRPKSGGHREPSLPNRRKSIDESLKDIVKRLELVDENQRELVKKPPMLRSFRAQIDNFDSRLKHLEAQLESVQGIAARNAESLGSLGRGHKDVLTRADAHDAALGTTHQAVTDLRAALHQLGKEHAAKAEESLSHQGKQALELQNRMAAIERAGEEQHAKSVAELSQRVAELAASFPKAKDYDAALADLAKQIASLPQPKNYDAALEELAKRVSNLPQPKDYDQALAELNERMNNLPQPKEYDEALEDLANKIASLPPPKDYDATFSELSERIAALPQQKDYDGALEDLGKKFASLPQPKDYDVALAELNERLNALPQPKDYDGALEDLATKVAGFPQPKDYDAALAELAQRLDKLPQPKNYDQEFQNLSDAAEQSKAAIEAVQKELLAKLDSPSSGKELGEVAAQQRQHAEKLQALASRLEELRSVLEARIGEIGARTDQREELLLSLQSRVTDADGKTSEGPELLPVIAGLRMELQTLAADQAKVSSALGALSQSVSALGEQQTKLGTALDGLAPDESALQALAAEQAKLAEALAGLNRPQDDSKFNEALEALSQKLDTLTRGPDDSNFGEALAALSLKVDSLALPQADPQLGEALAALSQKLETLGHLQIDPSLAETLANLKGDLQGAPATLEDEKVQAALEALSEKLEAFARPQESSNLKEAFETLSKDLETWKAETGEAHKSFDERLANESRILETLSSALLQWRADGDASRAALEERLSAKVETIVSQAPAPEPVAAPTPAAVPVSVPAPVPAPSAGPVHEESAEKRAEPLVIEMAEIVEPASESAEELEFATADETPIPGGWRMQGGSQSRRWSSPVECPVSVASSDKTLTAMTPTITASTEFPVGPVLYLGKKVIYGHGPNLCGAWPGKATSTVPLQEQLPADPWRLAAIDGHAFCVEEDQVEIVSLSSWRVVSRFSGTYVDQICTDNHWVGLASSMGKLHIDYRNTQGRLFGTPISLPMDAVDYQALAAEGERIFVAAKNGRILRVEVGESREFAPAEKGTELLSMSTQKNGLVVLVRSGGKDIVRLYGFDGKLLKHLALGFTQGTDHPVHIADRLYLVDSEAQKLVTVNLKKMEVATTADLPGKTVNSFCGVFRGDSHAILATVGDKEHAQLLVLDPKTGTSMAVCDVTEPTIYVLAAESRIVVATTCFYQNMIRVFDPFKSDQAARAA